MHHSRILSKDFENVYHLNSKPLCLGFRSSTNPSWNPKSKHGHLKTRNATFSFIFTLWDSRLIFNQLTPETHLQQLTETPTKMYHSKILYTKNSNNQNLNLHNFCIYNPNATFPGAFETFITEGWVRKELYQVNPSLDNILKCSIQQELGRNSQCSVKGLALAQVRPIS